MSPDPTATAPPTAQTAPEDPLSGWVSCPRCSRRGRRGQPFCEQCGARLFEAAPQPPATRRSLACRQCGATIAFPEGERTATCPFCDTPYVAEGEITPDRYVPEFVLPFGLTEAQARERFGRWLARSGVFAPGDLRQRARLEAPKGVYIPFWSFSARSASRFQARIGEYWYQTQTYTTTVNGKTVTRTRQVRHTEWYPFGGEFHQFHAHYLVSGSKGLPQAEADAIAPFPVAEMLRYQPQYLAGWWAEEYSVDREQAEHVSKQAFAAQERAAIGAYLPGDTHDDLHVETSFSDVTEDLLYLPVWVLAFRYKERVFRYVLNGATGREWGQRPRSAPRIAAALVVGIALAVLAFLWASGRLGR
jgi:hypothetical protein